MGIRSRALDVLYEMADKSTAPNIVNKFLEFLADAENEVAEQLVLKVAILAERWATKFDWYVDVILRLMAVAGDAVSDDIWHRVVQIMTNDKDLQPYAAERLFRTLQPRHVHATAVIVGAFVVGEFGYLIADKARE